MALGCSEIRNELLRGEAERSTFEEREAKTMANWLLRIVFSENLMSDQSKECLIEVGCK